MEMSNKELNVSIKFTTKIITDNQKQLISLVNYVILCGFISMFGSVANVINMVVFYRQGLNTTINISFFSLTVSDLCGLVLQQLFNVYVNPLFMSFDLPIVYTEIQHLTIAVTREMFARITCLITAFITIERCLCVVYPLHVKRIITPKINTAIIIFIYTFTLLSPLPVYCTTYIDWKFYPDSNRTLLGLAFTKYHDISDAFLYMTHASFTLLGFLSVLVFTLILIYKLEQKIEWRETANVHQENVKSISKRDRATISMVVLIAGILVVCYTPAVLLGLVTFIEPQFSVGGRYYNLYYILWTFALLFENINSSVNIFLYYKMSSNYRLEFRELFSRWLQLERDHE